MTTMNEIEAAAKVYAEERAVLAERVEALEDETRTLRRRRMPGIKRAAALAVQAYDRLYAAIDSSRDLFRRPRSVVIEGIRVGVQKSKGRLVWDDDAAVVRRIRKHLADRADDLIIVKEAPSRQALARLTTAELKKIGVEVAESGDEVLIKPADSAIDKLVAALLADADEAEADPSGDAGRSEAKAGGTLA